MKVFNERQVVPHRPGVLWVVKERILWAEGSGWIPEAGWDTPKHSWHRCLHSFPRGKPWPALQSSALYAPLGMDTGIVPAGWDWASYSWGETSCAARPEQVGCFSVNLSSLRVGLGWVTSCPSSPRSWSQGVPRFFTGSGLHRAQLWLHGFYFAFSQESDYFFLLIAIQNVFPHKISSYTDMIRFSKLM